jgi:outer membrane receptor protein involved in Fe transport
LALSNTLSQQSGSRIFQNLSDYIYTAGGNVAYNVNMFNRRQTIKVGYMFQVKDRLYDAQLFANYLPTDNATLRLLTPSVVFNAENFGNGVNNKFAFNAIKGNTFRYLANTILNAGFIQFDNSFSPELRVVWGVRVENYDQLIGSVKKYDPRHTYSQVNDFLPGINATYKLNTKTNLRLSASQTVIRPELRELSALNLYDFELNASVQGYPDLLRTKITNLDARYELYPATGEMITAGIFYKDFQNPIEQIFSEGAGGASTFTYRNAAKAYAYGIEVEFRKKLSFITTLKTLLFKQMLLIYSRIQDAKYQIDRPLQGQSPYTVNVSLLYDLPKHDFTASVLFNQVGQRIYLVGDLTSGSASPDIWEAPRPILDLQLSKKVLKQKAEIKLNISDIINQTQYFYQNADGNKTSFQKNTDAYRFTRRFGTTFSLTVNYSL